MVSWTHPEKAVSRLNSDALVTQLPSSSLFNDKNGHRDLCDPDTGPVWYPVIGIRLPQGFGCVSSLRLYRWQNGSGVSYDWECQIRITQYRNMNEKTMIVIVTKDNWHVK